MKRDELSHVYVLFENGVKKPCRSPDTFFIGLFYQVATLAKRIFTFLAFM